MARVIDAKYSTLIGTAQQVEALLRRLSGPRAAVVDLKFSNLVLLDASLDRARLREALAITPTRTAVVDE